MTTMTRTFRSDKSLCESKPRARTDPSKPVPPKKRPLQVPECQGCRETEWHFSGRSPGEPDRGAPVVIKCHVCSCDWHVQCVAPGHTPGDEFDFFHDRWTWQRCDVESGALECGSSPLRPAHREAGGIRFQKAEAIEREWRRADELVSLVRFRGGTRLWLSKAACDGLPNELHARWRSRRLGSRTRRPGTTRSSPRWIRRRQFPASPSGPGVSGPTANTSA